MHSDAKENLYLDNNVFFYKKKHWPLARRAYGLLQIRIYLPHENGLQNVPFLPCALQRGNQTKMYLANCNHCLVNQSRGICQCPPEKRAFVGVYCE